MPGGLKPEIILNRGLNRGYLYQAYKEGMIFPKYIWMIIGWYSANWYLEGDENEISCNRTEMEIAVYGHLTTEVQFFSNKHQEILDYGIVMIIKEAPDPNAFNKFPH